MDNWYYPMGAANDARAPYNQPDDSWIEEECLRLAYNDATSDGTGDGAMFFDYVVEHFPDRVADKDDIQICALCKELAKDENILFDYYKENEDYYWEIAMQADEEPEFDYEKYLL